MERLKLAIVVPRFGEGVSGGAELLARWLAERLAARGDAIDVFTTCASDHRLWRNDLDPGVERVGDITVRRFPLRPRDVTVFNQIDNEIRKGTELTDDLELVWLRNGASSEEMEDELEATAPDYDAVLALPYLFGTTYFAHEVCPDNCVLIPCLHDEPAAHTRFVQRMMTNVAGIMFNSDAEARLAARLVPDLAPSSTVGVGIESRGFTDRRKRNAVPTLLYVGRREPDKNTPALIEYFAKYKSRRPSNLKLTFIGAGDPLPERADMAEIDADWRTDDQYRDCTVFCHPGINESFSIVLMQAWLAERPALVHADCAVTREHCERSNGGLWFRSYAEFEEIVDRLLASPDLRGQLGVNGRAYVEREYSWDAVLGRFDAAMGRILEGRVEHVAFQTP